LQSQSHQKGPESNKVDDRSITIKKFVPPPDVTSDPVERDELLTQAEIFSGMSAQRFQQVLNALCNLGIKKSSKLSKALKNSPDGRELAQLN
jgi:hypothetical protein